MASLGPNSQRGYTQQNSPSSVNLLSSQSGSSPSGVQAAFTFPRSVQNKPSSASLNDSRYASDKRVPASISDKFSLSPDPSAWGDVNVREMDDELHNPDPMRDCHIDKGGYIFTTRGVLNLGCLFVLALGLLTLFAGYPIISYFTKKKPDLQGGFNVGGLNASGQVPTMTGNRGLVDIQTPTELHWKPDYVNKKNWQLIFSDEFNVDGRTFWPGDDPYWEALNLHYWQTNNLEWLDPSAIVTKDGYLQITMTEQESHNLNYTSGMMTTWNKFCFTGGLVEVSVILPGANNVVGLWPAIWTMGNLGRAGYGAALDGMWPYSYDSCDVGTAPNQTKNGLPLAATENGDPANGNVLSYLPGQRLSRCSCPGSSHPGPMHQDGSYVGRAAPEIDIYEATFLGTENPIGQVSQSSQWAPFNEEYQVINTTSSYSITNTSATSINGYKGGVYQQAASALTFSDPTAYEFNGMNTAVYGVQYQPGFDDAYISWIANNEIAWTLEAAALAADNVVEIGARPISQEPHYIIMNLGISMNFGTPDLEHLQFPTTMYVDYVRVYQDPNNLNYGCDPKDFPTEAYINKYIEAYTNPNLTTWSGDYGQPFPKNKWIDTC